MANIFQKMFLSKQKLNDIDKKQEILKFIKAGTVINNEAKINGSCVIRSFSIENPGYNIYAERSCDTSRSPDDQISFTFRFGPTKNNTTFATHSDIDEFAKIAYMKMYKIWYKSKTKAK